VNNKEITQLTNISNSLNAYFTSIGENFVKDIDKHNRTQHFNNYKTYCTLSLKNSLFCTPVGRNELIYINSKLKNNKSPGPDNIGSKLVKDNVSILVDPLIHLFNLSITTGVVPDKLKLAKVIPV